MADQAASNGTAGKGKVKSLTKMAENKILKDLGSSLETHARSAVFACGGSLPFKQILDSTSSGDQHITKAEALETTSDDGASTHSKHPATQTDPLTQNTKGSQASTLKAVYVWFGDKGNATNIVFSATGIPSKDLEQLVLPCQPASFGRGGEAVLDEGYRKAGNLDNEAFATNFCPYQAGIIDVVSQLLVPQTPHDRHCRSIKAELYKLNVYTAPSGRFKAHVVTPRSKDQIGSLVVSLPTPHQGGELAIRNAGKSMSFDWSSNDKADPEIKWAAFYSDCEHEVHEVTSGHRVTLTYNLYVTRGLGHLADCAPVLDS